MDLVKEIIDILANIVSYDSDTCKLVLDYGCLHIIQTNFNHPLLKSCCLRFVKNMLHTENEIDIIIDQCMILNILKELSSRASAEIKIQAVEITQIVIQKKPGYCQTLIDNDIVLLLQEQFENENTDLTIFALSTLKLIVATTGICAAEENFKEKLQKFVGKKNKNSTIKDLANDILNLFEKNNTHHQIAAQNIKAEINTGQEENEQRQLGMQRETAKNDERILFVMDFLIKKIIQHHSNGDYHKAVEEIQDALNQESVYVAADLLNQPFYRTASRFTERLAGDNICLEISGQQKGKPEAMQFEASQRLLDPSEAPNEEQLRIQSKELFQTAIEGFFTSKRTSKIKSREEMNSIVILLQQAERDESFSRTQKKGYHAIQRYQYQEVEDNVVLKTIGGKIVVDKTVLFDLLYRVHEKKGHGGRDVMYKSAKLQKYDGISKEILEIFLQCCQSCELKKNKTKRGLVVRPIICKDFNQRCQMDLIDLQSKKDGEYSFIFVYQDHFTKYILLRPLMFKTAAAVVNVLKQIFADFGPPSILQSDNGREFANSSVEELVSLYGGKMIHGRPRHSQSQGSVERANRDIQDILTIEMQRQQRVDWSNLLGDVQLKKNMRFHRGIGRTPYQALFGRRCTLDESNAETVGETNYTTATDNDEDGNVDGEDGNVDDEDGNEDGENESLYQLGEKEEDEEEIISEEENIEESEEENIEESEEEIEANEAKQQQIRKERNGTSVALNQQATKMLAASERRFAPVSVGQNVRIPIPDVDKGKTDDRSVMGVILEEKNGFFKVGTQTGVLKSLYSRNQIEPVTQRFISIDSVPDVIINSLRTAANAASVSGGQGFLHCNCLTGCQGGRCRCLKAERLVICQKVSNLLQDIVFPPLDDTFTFNFERTEVLIKSYNAIAGLQKLFASPHPLVVEQSLIYMTKLINFGVGYGEIHGSGVIEHLLSLLNKNDQYENILKCGIKLLSKIVTSYKYVCFTVKAVQKKCFIGRRLIYALKALSNIIWCNGSYWQKVIERGALQFIKDLLNRNFIFKVCCVKLIASLTRYGETRINLAIEQGLINPIIQQLNNMNNDDMKEIIPGQICILKNIFTYKPKYFSTNLIAECVISFLSNNLADDDFMYDCLSLLCSIISEIKNAKILNKLKQCGGDIKIKKLLHHKDYKIKHLAIMINEFIISEPEKDIVKIEMSEIISVENELGERSNDIPQRKRVLDGDNLEQPPKSKQPRCISRYSVSELSDDIENHHNDFDGQSSITKSVDIKPIPIVSSPAILSMLPKDKQTPEFGNIQENENVFVPFWYCRPSLEYMENCCKNLELKFNYGNVYVKYLSQMNFKNIISFTSTPAGHILTAAKNGFDCLSIIFTGEEKYANLIEKQLNKKFIDALDELDKEKIKSVIGSFWLTDEHIKIFTQWFKCRVLVYCYEKGWQKFGEWNSQEEEGYTPVFMMQKKKAGDVVIYEIVTSLND